MTHVRTCPLRTLRSRHRTWLTHRSLSGPYVYVRKCVDEDWGSVCFGPRAVDAYVRA